MSPNAVGFAVTQTCVFYGSASAIGDCQTDIYKPNAQKIRQYSRFTLSHMIRPL